MKAQLNKSYQYAAVILTCCIVHLFVFGQNPLPSSSVNPNQTETGKLQINGSEQVQVNGNPVPDGTTIFTGADIRLPKSTSAAVSFEKLGRVILGCGSIAKVTFTDRNIEVTVLTGYAQLITNQGVTGRLILPDGKTLPVDSSAAASTIETGPITQCVPVSAPLIIGGGSGVKISTIVIAAALAVGGATALVFALGGSNSQNATPTPTPTVSNVVP